MKYNGFKLVSECVDDDIKSRPISTLDKNIGKEAKKIAQQSTAGETEDPDPKKLPLEKEKGTAAGDEKGKLAKELSKE